MTWSPRNKLFSTDNFGSSDTGYYSYTDFSAQNNIGAVVALRNIATGKSVTTPAGEPWPPMLWDELSDFDMLWAANSDNWNLSGAVPIQNLSRGTAALEGYNSIVNTGDWTWTDGVLIESEVYISRLTGQTTGSSDNLYGILMQYSGEGLNGFDTVTVQREPLPGFIIGKDADHETFVPATGITSNTIGFRYGVNGTTGHFVTTDGYSTLITGVAFKASHVFGSGFDTDGDIISSTSMIIAGDLTEYFTGTQSDSSSRIEYGKLHIKTPVSDIAGDFIDDVSYSTGSEFLTGPPFLPETQVQKWDSAYVNILGSVNDGICKIHAEYSEDGTTWTTGVSSSSFNTGGLYQIDLGSIPVTDHDDARIRFTVEQSSIDRYEPPCQVDYISVIFQAYDGAAEFLYLNPAAGSAAGEYPVLLSIDPKTERHVNPYPTGDALFYSRLTGFSIGLKASDSISGFTGVTNDINSHNSLSIFSEPSWGFRSNSGLTDAGLESIFRSAPVNANIQASFQQIGMGELLASPDFELLYTPHQGGDPVTGVLTGTYTGLIGSSLSAYTYPGAGSLVGDNFRIGKIIYADTGGAPSSYWTQKWKGAAGHGFSTETLSFNGMPDDYLLIDAVVQVSRGGVCFTLDEFGSDHTVDPCYPVYRYQTPSRVQSLMPMPTGNFRVIAYGVSDSYSAIDTGECEWGVGDCRIRTLNNDALTWSQHPINQSGPRTDELAMDVWFKQDGHSRHSGTSDTSLIKLTGYIDSKAYSFGIGLDNRGFPVSHFIADSTQVITGNFGAVPDRWNHVQLASYDGYYSLYLNGELCAHTKDVVNQWPRTGDVVVGSDFVGSMSDARIMTGDINPVQNSVMHAFATPLKFQTHYQLPTGIANTLYRFDRGTLWDRGTGNHGRCIVPEINYSRWYTEREAEGVFGEGIEFQGSYGMASGVTEVSCIDADAGWIGMWLAGVAASETGKHSRVFRIGNTQLDLITNDSGTIVPRYNYHGDVMTGFTTIQPNFQYNWINIKHFTNDGGDSEVAMYHSTGNATGDLILTGLVAANVFTLTGQLEFGHDPLDPLDEGSVFIDEFGLFTGALPDPTGRYMDIDYKKATPDEPVYLNGTELTGTRVSHLGVYDKEIIIPAQTSFSATGGSVRISVKTDAGILDVTPNYVYVGARKIVLETGSVGLWNEARDTLCKTKSAIRIGATVPEDGVNLALITSPEFSVGNNLSLIDSAGSISDNYVASLKAYDSLSAFTGVGVTGATSTDSYYYTGEVDTDDILISTYTMQRQDAEFASPLFHYHKVGGDSLWLYQVGATGDTVTADIFGLIRDNISMTDQDGSPVPVQDFPWDIRVSKKREDDFVLPHGTFNVEILSRDRYLPGKSLFIEYNAADPSNEYSQVKGWRECLNPKPIYRHTSEDVSVGETFCTIDSINFTDTSSATFRSNSGPVLKINQLTGDWVPSLHALLFKDDNII